jgi:hypothetical protein
MKFSNPRLLKALLVVVFSFSLAGFASGATKIWTNVAGGTWSTAANWTPAGAPGAGDTVFITNNGSYLVTLDANATILSLTLGGASGAQTLSNNASTLRFNAPSTVRNNGRLIVHGGTLGNTNLTIASGATFTLAGAGDKVFDTLRLLNEGTVAWLAGQICRARTRNDSSVC